jgi:vancomycin resistance protein YoaR
VIEGPEHIRIEPSQTGVRIDGSEVAAAVLRAAMSSERRAPLPLQQVAPKLTTEQAEALGIRRQLGHFTTRHACCEARVKNIHRIADLLDHTVVRPGETFSVNAAVGPRSVDTGFVLAPGIEDGEMVDSIGGGVSQFATTLFNAVYFAGYDIVERQPHSYWFTRYPMGHEATLGYPKPDLAFKNDSAAGLVIDTSYTDTSITVTLFGDTQGRHASVKVSGQREVVQPPIELEADPKVLPWRERTRYPGTIGWSVLVTRTVTFGDGTKKDEERKVTYKPRARIMAVHPCRIPKGEPGYTGELCPVPPDSSDAGVP